MTKEQAKLELWTMKKLTAEGKAECDKLIEEIYIDFEKKLLSLSEKLKNNIDISISSISLQKK